MSSIARLLLVAILVTNGSLGCERHDVDVEPPAVGRELSRSERSEIQHVADAAFRDVRSQLEGLPPRLTLIIRWGKDVIPETGESGTAGFPGNVAWTIDPDRDVAETIRKQLRPTLFHELHHLARASRMQTRTLLDRVVTEGLATAFERDFGKVDPPWGQAPPGDPMIWTREVLSQPETADVHAWVIRHPDGRRWIGMRVGTFLADRATRASGRSSAALVFTSTADVLHLANVQ
jgi:hypothetical protein